MAPLPVQRPGRGLVFLVASEFQLVVQVVEERRGIGRAHRREERVVVHGFGKRIDRRTDEARVDSSGDQPVVALELLQELLVVDAQVGLHPVVGAGTGIAGRPLGDFALARRLDGVTGGQCRQVFVQREFLDLGEKRLQVIGLFLQRVVVPGRGRERRQEQRMRQVQSAAVAPGGGIDERRDQDQAVEVHAVAALQVVRQPGAADAAVTFAQHELRRSPQAVFVDVLLDEGGDRFDVGIHAPEFLALGLAQRLRKPGPDRIDHDQVGHVDDRIFVVHPLRRGRVGVAGVVDDYALGPQDAHVQPQRRGTGAAVERKHDRPFAGRIIALAVISRVAEARDRLVVFFHDQPADGGAVVDPIAVDRHLVFGRVCNRFRGFRRAVGPGFIPGQGRGAENAHQDERQELVHGDTLVERKTA